MELSPFISQEVWSSEVPLMFVLHERELVTNKSPFPFYMMLPRMSFLHISAVDLVRKHFLSFAPNEDEIWFECNGNPVKWYYPVGVLFDVYTMSLDTLPLVFTVHFSAFPESQLTRCFSLDRLRHYYFQSVKQSLYMRYGSIGNMVETKREKQNTMWEGICSHSFERFHSIYSNLFSNSVVDSSNPEEEESVLISNNQKPLKYYPVRICKDMQLIQRPVAFSSNQSFTVGNYLHNLGLLDKKIFCQGVQIDENIELMLLIKSACMVDGWLYLILA